jgi:hypothetical protein
VDGALALAVGGAGSLVLGKTAADLAGLLGAEVEGQVLLVLVEQTQLGALVGVDDGQDAGDGLADIVAVGEMLVWLWTWSDVVCVDGVWVFEIEIYGEFAIRWDCACAERSGDRIDVSCIRRCRFRGILRSDEIFVVAAQSHLHLHNPRSSQNDPPFLQNRVCGNGNRSESNTHMRRVLAEAPLAIFWTRSWLSSVFNSSSCWESSSLFLPQS